MDRPLHVLVVEDSKQMSHYLSQALVLVDTRITVDVVATLHDAVNKVLQGGIDVVLLDLLLPDADGVDGIVKVLETDPEMPIVVLSGAFPALELESLSAGAQEYVTKGQGFTPTTLVRALRYAVIRCEVRSRFLTTRKSLDDTKVTLQTAGRLEEQIQEVREKAVAGTGGVTINAQRP